jgi:uncharacterized membrane protein HdeD (DUF308 family)
MSIVDRTQSELGSSGRTRHSPAYLYIVRGIIAVVWAGAFAAVSGHLTAAAITLLVIYPAIDVAASVYDAVKDRATGLATTQWVNAVVSTAALIGLAVAGSRDNAWVLHAFGVWATVSGLIQLFVTLRRRQQFGTQWAMLISGGLSTLAGIAFNVAAGAHDPKLSMLSGYALLGGILFLVDGFMLRRRPQV